MFHFLALKWRTKARMNAALISLLNFHIFALNLIIEFLSVFNLAKELYTRTYRELPQLYTRGIRSRISLYRLRQNLSRNLPGPAAGGRELRGGVRTWMYVPHRTGTG